MARDVQEPDTKKCASCGQAVQSHLLACPACGGGVFTVPKTRARPGQAPPTDVVLSNEMGQESQAATPVVGMHIPWKIIEGEVFRVTHFTPFALVEGGKVTGSGVFGAYGLLTVESPILNQPVYMPVRHRDEFLNFWEFKPFVGDAETELLVSYLPYRGFLGPLLRLGLPCLHMRLTGKGELERYYADDTHWQKPSAREELFWHRYCNNCNARIRSFSIRCHKCKRAIGGWY